MYIVLAQLLVEGKHQRRHKKKNGKKWKQNAFTGTIISLSSYMSLTVYIDLLREHKDSTHTHHKKQATSMVFL